MKLNKTRGFARGLWLLEDIPVSGEAKQCQVTLVQQLDAGGFVPTWLVDKMPQALLAVQSVIDEFREEGVQSRATEVEEPVEECSCLGLSVSLLLHLDFTDQERCQARFFTALY